MEFIIFKMEIKKIYFFKMEIKKKIDQQNKQRSIRRYTNKKH